MTVQALPAPPTGTRPFPFVDVLEQQVATLLALSVEEKLDAFHSAAEILSSADGRSLADTLAAELIAAGYPAPSAHREVAALPGLLTRDNLGAVVDNAAALPGGRVLLDGGFVPVGDVTVTGFPVGPVLVLGSGNACLPAVISTVHALLASCPVALRGSRVNHPVLELLVRSLSAAGGPVLRTLLDCVHPFFVDHRDDRQQLQWLLRNGPFGAGVFWGGREMLDDVLPVFAANPRHPVPVPMEPLTGVALLTERFVFRSATSPAEVAGDLGEAMSVFSQQLCSSPTEGYFVGRHAGLLRLAQQLAAALDVSPAARGRRIGARQAMLLDRVRDRCEQAGSTVLTPADGGTAWTVVVSEQRSVFVSDPAALPLPIHDRVGFLELISVTDLDEAADLIAALPTAPCHAAIKQVQTILRFAEVADAQQLAAALRTRGGIYRVVPPAHVAVRHALEPYDGQHFLSLLTRQTVVV